MSSNASTTTMRDDEDRHRARVAEHDQQQQADTGDRDAQRVLVAGREHGDARGLAL